MIVQNKVNILIGLLTIGTLMLAGCETAPRPTGAKPPTEKEADKAATSGEFVRAAREFERLAKKAVPPEKQHYQLRAIELYLKAAQISEAHKKISAINVSQLDPSFKARKRVLQAQLAASEGNYARAIIMLNAAKRARNLNPILLADIHWTRAQARISLNQPYRAAKDLIAREKYLVGPEAIHENQLQLWKILTSLQRAELQTRKQRARNPVLRGWMELAIISIDHEARARAMAKVMKQWKLNNPTHPISKELLATLSSKKPTLIGRIDRIALLLPLTSRHGRAARAVRDGFMAMDKENTDPDKPKIRVYDIGSDPTQVVDFYKQAAREGAQLIVGPLGLNAVKNVVRRTNLKVPTLLLSHSSIDVDAPNVYQFGLPPEQEARQAAERAYLDGHRQAAVLYPDNGWGERMQVAFTEHWQRLGGTLIVSQSYAWKASEYSQPIKDLLNITQSQERKNNLQGKLKTKLVFEPRARTDLDFIFLAADSRRGRLIKPQLNYFRTARLPVYSTSHIFHGKADAANDTDLNGIIFGDMPWMLIGDKRMQNLRKKLHADWPSARSPFDRLFALGVDSYAVIPHLNRIASQESVRFNGVTSGLSIDQHGRIHRQLLWARFRRGVPRILDTFVNYRENLNISDGKDARKTSTTRSAS